MWCHCNTVEQWSRICSYNLREGGEWPTGKASLTSHAPSYGEEGPGHAATIELHVTTSESWPA